MRTAYLLLILVQATAALAVDTWEPYPGGAGAIEFYVTRGGIGDGDSVDGKTSVVLGPSWGIHETTHLSLYTGIVDPDESEGGLDFLSLDLFRNLYGGFVRPLKLDAYFGMTAFGPGLDMSSSLAGLEANLDFEHTGLYARPSISWFHDETGGRDHSIALAAGLWRQLGERTQLLGEATFSEREGDLKHETTAAGVNVQLSGEVELILELRSGKPTTGSGRSYDATVGAVTVW